MWETEKRFSTITVSDTDFSSAFLISFVVIPSYNCETTVATILSDSKNGVSTITNDFNSFS